jgi:hypothetical protein
MAALKAKARSLERISNIRAALTQHAQHAAGKAASAVADAIKARRDAEQRSVEALAAWGTAVSGRDNFDPAVTAIWTNEFLVRDTQHISAEASQIARERECATAHTVWQKAIFRAGQSAENLAVAERKVAAHRTEQQLAMQADDATRRIKCR